jgi:hypothetical protein
MLRQIASPLARKDGYHKGFLQKRMPQKGWKQATV